MAIVRRREEAGETQARVRKQARQGRGAVYRDGSKLEDVTRVRRFKADWLLLVTSLANDLDPLLLLPWAVGEAGEVVVVSGSVRRREHRGCHRLLL